jgi:hypothetical protein
MARPTKAEWAAIRASAEEVLDDNFSTVWAFRNKAAAMFKAMLEDKEQPFKRRPPVSLRLICAGDPPAKLIVHPGWNNHLKTVLADRTDCELLEEQPTTGFIAENGEKKEVEARQFIRRLTMHVSPKPEAPLTPYHYHSTAAKDAARIIEVMRDFLRDHRAVFARSHDHCCVCGRGLSDELSRSRGIGPECIKIINYSPVAALDWNSIIAKQPAHDPIPDSAEPEVFSLTP